MGTSPKWLHLSSVQVRPCSTPCRCYEALITQRCGAMLRSMRQYVALFWGQQFESIFSSMMRQCRSSIVFRLSAAPLLCRHKRSPMGMGRSMCCFKFWSEAMFVEEWRFVFFRNVHIFSLIIFFYWKQVFSCSVYEGGGGRMLKYTPIDNKFSPLWNWFVTRRILFETRQFSNCLIN